VCAGTALAEDKEPFAVVEFGGAGEWGLPNGGASLGPTAAVEFTPIKNWLEIETGVTSLFSRGQTEWGTDFVFKKTFDLSPTVELAPGIGPEWNHTTGGGRTTNSIAGEAVLEFMFWPTPARKFGWFLEPSYSYDFGKGQQSLGVSAGLLIAIPQRSNGNESDAMPLRADGGIANVRSAFSKRRRDVLGRPLQPAAH
jgi:hypothetical protein